ncbi:hypothetical protein ABIF90_003720 [Bradyrhizobium japonicum]
MLVLDRGNWAKKISLASCVLAWAVYGHAQEKDLELIVGRWTHDASGEFIQVMPSFSGWEALHSHYGQFAITRDGRAGANLKMSGRGPTSGSVIDCWFYVSVNNATKMTWSLREGPSDKCLSGVYTKVPTAAELAAMRAAEAAEKARTEEARRAAEAAARKAAEEEAARVAEAQRQREERDRRARLGPPSLREIDLVYFDRDEDDGLISRAFERHNINYSTRASSETKPSNVITCTPDVDTRAVRALARILIRAGMKILSVEPSEHPQFKQRITVESYIQDKRRPPITEDDLDSITECYFRHPIVQTYKIKFISDCRYALYIWLLYYVDGDWKMASVGWLHPGRTLLAKDRAVEIESRRNEFWYFARSARGGDMTPASPDKNSVRRRLPDGTYVSFLAARGGETELRCFD